jgi:hypothetical protein
MTRMKIGNYGIVLAVLISFFVAVNIFWIKRDQAPPMWDQSHYLGTSEVFYHTLTSEGIISFSQAFERTLRTKAPLISVLPIPFYILGGDNYKSALYVNLFFIIIGSYFLFKLGTLVYGRGEALVSVFIVNTFPLIFAMSREFLVEYGLMVFVIMWMYYFMKSDAFENKSYAYPLGIVLGLGMLMKISFPLYIVFPTLYMFATKVTALKRVDKSSLINIVITLITGVFISGTWYFENFRYVTKFAFGSGFGDVAKNYGMGDIFSLKTVLAYWVYIINYGISSYFSFLIIFLVVTKLVTRKKEEHLGDSNKTFFLLIWFAVPFIMFTFGMNKDYRYIAPVLPAIGILMGMALIRMSRIGYRRALLFILLMPLLFNYLFISFSPKNIFLRFGGLEILNNNLAYAHPPRKEHWPNKELVTLIHNDSWKTSIIDPRVTLLFNHHYLNFINLNYYSINSRFDATFDTTDYLSNESPERAAARIERDSNYILTKSDQLGPGFTNTQNIQVIALLREGRLSFKEIGSMPLPDKTFLTIYKKRSNE